MSSVVVNFFRLHYELKVNTQQEVNNDQSNANHYEFSSSLDYGDARCDRTTNRSV